MASESAFPYQVPVPGVVVRICKTPTSNGYDSFTIVYHQDGARKREVRADFEAAKKRGKEIADSLAAGRVMAAAMTTEDREKLLAAEGAIKGIGVPLVAVCQEYAECHKLLGGIPPLQAVRDYIRRHGEVVERKTVSETVSEFLDAKRQGIATRIGGKAKKISAKYLYQMERRLEPFSERFKTYIASVSGEDINDFIHGLKVEGRTKNNYIGDIHGLIEFAKLKRYVARDHHELDAVQRAAEADLEIEIFTAYELQTLLQHAREELATVLAIGGFAGLRTSEILRLDWSKINLKTGMIETLGKVHTKHGRARRLVPIQPNLDTLLKATGKRSGPVWSFSEQTLYDAIRDAIAEANKETPNKKQPLRWKPNGLRDSYISHRLAIAKSADQVALEAGNSPQMIFEHYRELVTPEQASAWFSIGLPAEPGKVVPFRFAQK
jgi:integrase